jgi:hypothetical protein
MNFEYNHTLPEDDVRARIEALGEYLTNRHKIDVTWSGDRAMFHGRFKKLVKIVGELSLAEGKVLFAGKDPGRVWRGQAIKYIRGKLDAYLDPGTPLDSLRRA